MSQTLTIRRLDARIYSGLQAQAARHGRSMEAEARAILQSAVAPEARAWAEGVYERARRRTAGQPQTPAETLIGEGRATRG